MDHTGSGKTYTMQGELGTEKAGIQPRLIGDLFMAINQADPNLLFEVSVHYMELYCEKLYDLLDPRTNPQDIKVVETMKKE
eukprot:UN05863